MTKHMNELKVGLPVRNVHTDRIGIITGFTGFHGDQVKVKRIIDAHDERYNFHEVWASASLEIKD